MNCSKHSCSSLESHSNLTNCCPYVVWEEVMFSILSVHLSVCLFYNSGSSCDRLHTPIRPGTLPEIHVYPLGTPRPLAVLVPPPSQLPALPICCQEGDSPSTGRPCWVIFVQNYSIHSCLKPVFYISEYFSITISYLYLVVSFSLDPGIDYGSCMFRFGFKVHFLNGRVEKASEFFDEFPF